MNLDATTFALEVLNFLVLVWLLQRLLYRPVLEVIERRRAEDAQTVAQAQALREQAQALKAQYEQRLAGADQERERARARLDTEIAAERSKRLDAVEAEAAAERERRQALLAREAADDAARRERQASELAARFATRLLDRLAGPALDDLLVDLAVSELPGLPPPQRDALRSAFADRATAVQAASAYPMAEPRRAALRAALAALAGRAVEPDFVEDRTLRAGLRLQVGAWVLTADLNDELAFFAAPVADGR